MKGFTGENCVYDNEMNWQLHTSLLYYSYLSEEISMHEWDILLTPH